MYTVDIDTGGTMTDALISDGQQLLSIKVDTTPHDLTVCLLNALSEAAEQLSLGSLSALLDQVSFIRWSSTVTSNVLAERRGPKIGLLAASGHEEDLYGGGRSPAIGTLVEQHNAIGLTADPDPLLVLGAVKRLFEEGVRRICVSLQGTFPENGAEQRVKEIIEEQFPDHYLGSVPVLLGSEMVQVPDDMTRAHYALINAYVHTPLASSLFKAEDLLKYQERWNGPLLIGHTNGGVARVGKTKAVDTIESGPVFGTYAGAYFARLYGLDAVVCLDVGGTTAKASVVSGGEPRFQREGDLFGIPVRTSLPLLRSVAIGGGSIARPGETGTSVRLGPDSMGASPGPACYGLGGTEATLTDAFLILGFLDPARFLGGRRRLDGEQARQAIERHLAQPLQIPAERAARMMADHAFDLVAELVRSTLAEAGRGTAGTGLFAYGGNGPLFAAPVAARLGISQAYLFALGPVFSAFGSAISDVVHVYERSVAAELRPRPLVEHLLAAFPPMRDQARRDLSGEGFEPGAARMKAEVELSDGQHSPVPVRVTLPNGNADALVQDLLAGYDRVAPPDYSRQLVSAELIRLRVEWPIASYEPAAQATATEDPSAARAGEKSLVLPDGPVAAAVYQWEQLRPGNRVSGPALVASRHTTAMVPLGWELVSDGYGNSLLLQG